MEQIQGMKTAIALGTFDGVHKAHREVINRAKTAAKQQGINCMVYTFDTHPQNVLKGEDIVKIITPAETKKEILLQMGIDNVHFEKTTKEFLNKSPEEFILNLVENFGAKVISAGYNYRFGKGGAGDTDLLYRLGEKYGFETIITPKITFDGSEVSSSVIRALIKDGEIEKANILLEKPFSFQGVVKEGKKLGRQLGFPTANTEMPSGMIEPSKGVYQSIISIDGKEYTSITNIGSNPTVENILPRAETYIYGFSDNIYGKTVYVSLMRKIRDEKKFNSIDELKKQIEKDIKSII